MAEYNLNKFVWAVNKLKLNQAEKALIIRKNNDPRVEINEEAIKEEYIRRAGLLAQYKPSLSEKGKIIRPEQPSAEELINDMKDAQIEQPADVSREEEAPKRRTRKDTDQA